MVVGTLGQFQVGRRLDRVAGEAVRGGDLAVGLERLGPLLGVRAVADDRERGNPQPGGPHGDERHRLDRLGRARELAQRASALGREFDQATLGWIAEEGEEDLGRRLAELVSAGILFRLEGDSGPAFRFKHALIQEAAYRAMLKGKRGEVHDRIAVALEKHRPELAEIEPEILAHHCTEAGRVPDAIRYWKAAGDRARARFANVEAVQHNRKALELLRTQPEGPDRDAQELGLLVGLGLPLTAMRGYASEEVGEVYGRARDLSLGLGMSPRVFPVLHGLYRYYFVRCHLRDALEIAERLMALAQAEDSEDLALEANRAIGFVLSMLGESAQARTHLERAIELYDPERHANHIAIYGTDPLVAARSNLAAAVLCLQGEPELALASSGEALRQARQIDNPFNLAWTLNYAAVVHQQCGDVEAVRATGEECIAVSERHDMAFWLAGGRVMRAWALVCEGRDGAIDELRDGLQSWLRTGAEVYVAYYASLLADAHARLAQTEEGLEVVASALGHVARRQERWWEPELERIRGELLRQLDPQLRAQRGEPEPIDCFRRAREIAIKQGARALELRACMSALRLADDGPQREQLRSCLEAFGGSRATRDLREAAHLLGEERS